MNDISKTIHKKIDEFWPDAQKSFKKIQKDTAKTLKKSEKQFKRLYSHTRKKTETLLLQAKREQLYHELGKNITSLLTSDQLKNKNVLKIATEIQQVNKKLRSKK